MLAVMRQMCRDPDSTIHAIVSGGRKVMSVYMHAMMQLVGRPQDKLFHILVHPVLEQQILKRHWLDFFYPRGPLRLGGRLIPADALLAYVEIPLLCVSPRESLKRDVPYAQMVSERQQEVEWLAAPPPLTIDVRKRELRIDHVIVKLRPQEFLWYFALVRLALEGRGRLQVSELARAVRIDARGSVAVDPDADDAGRFDDVVRRLRIYHRELFPNDPDGFPRVLKVDCAEVDPGLRNKASRINKQLRGALFGASSPYEIHGGKGLGYGVTLPLEKIRVLGARSSQKPG